MEAAVMHLKPESAFLDAEGWAAWTSMDVNWVGLFVQTWLGLVGL